MLLKYFYDKALAHASYLVGCQQSGEAVVIDPGRNVDQYLEAAKAEGMQIVGSAETHIHADFVSGSRELAERTGAKLYLSDEGPKEWKYQFADQYDSQLLKDGDAFYVGKVRLQVTHTPGHTPESISFVLTDEGGGANAPMGIFSGDFVFVGSIGRPDLLETASEVTGSAESGARELYHSMRRFRELPDHLQVWPAHGAGSACGKGLGAIPSSTVGYEKLFNPALQFDDEQRFVDYILADQPETPYYFAVMKRVNKEGPALLSQLKEVAELDPSDVVRLAEESLVFDPIDTSTFAKSHVPGTINVPAGMLVQWAGFFVDYDSPIYLLVDRDQLDATLRSLRSIGIDRVGGYFDAAKVQEVGLRTESYLSKSPEQLHEAIEQGEVMVVDVRAETEFEAGHLTGAEHHFLGKLLRTMDELPEDKPLVAQCLAGGRSAIATSILKRAGRDVVNLEGGYRAWVKAGFPVAREVKHASAGTKS